MPVAKGTKVIQIVNPIKGVVIDFELDKETAEILYLVSYEDENGEIHQRYFKEHHFTIDD